MYSSKIVFTRDFCILFLLTLIYVPVFGQKAEALVDFYGHKEVIKYDPKFSVFTVEGKELYGKVFETYFNQLETLTEYQDLLFRLEQVKEKYSLDDFGELLFLRKFADQAFKTKGQVHKDVFVWYILLKQNKSAYLYYKDRNAKVFIRTNLPPSIRLYCYVNFKGERLYEMSFLNTYRPQKYFGFLQYNHSHNNGKLRTFEIDTNKPPLLNAEKENRSITFSYNNRSYGLRYDLNLSIIQYFSDLPLFDVHPLLINYGFYHNKSLIAGFKQILENKPLEEGLNLLLAFTQHLPYKGDDDYWGYERFFFPDETLYYQYSDCEDRAILYSFLVKELYGIKSIMLYYGGDRPHMNVALSLNDKEYDESYMKINYKEEVYIICEPTGNSPYIGIYDVSLAKNLRRIYPIW